MLILRCLHLMYIVVKTVEEETNFQNTKKIKNKKNKKQKKQKIEQERNGTCWFYVLTLTVSDNQSSTFTGKEV